MPRLFLVEPVDQLVDDLAMRFCEREVFFDLRFQMGIVGDGGSGVFVHAEQVIRADIEKARELLYVQRRLDGTVLVFVIGRACDAEDVCHFLLGQMAFRPQDAETQCSGCQRHGNTTFLLVIQKPEARAERVLVSFARRTVFHIGVVFIERDFEAERSAARADVEQAADERVIEARRFSVDEQHSFRFEAFELARRCEKDFVGLWCQ